MKKILHLNLKSEYFDEIKSENKLFEYREDNEYWSKRLVGKNYDEVHFKKGYPKNTDTDKIIKRKYIGFEIKSINHKHFGSDDISVFAIHTNGDAV